MKRSALATIVVLVAAGSYVLGASTDKSLTATYSSVAEVILGANHAETNVVTAILISHRNAARAAADSGKWDEAAAQIALFANEGDNTVGGIRKRLLEGGHHHNAEGEAQGIYEPGYVVVTVAAKKAALDAAAKMQAAKDDAGRKAAWADFDKTAESVCPSK